ncbi:MAG: class B sortase [Oscillospiraceae bacterium]|nr:class B sortase [Ruminococcus sp.]MCD8346017.1 class B sortase [Oscillospiraceae bacterium]
MSMLNEVRPVETQERDRSFKGRVKDLLPWKGDSIKEIIRKVVYLGSICALIYCGYTVYVYQFGTSDMYENQEYLSNLYHSASDTTEEAENTDNTAVSEVTTVDNVDVTDDVTTDVEVSKYPEGMLSSFEAIYDINSDVIGWLSIDTLTDDDGNAYIDYPVMQTTDNDYYLTHDVFGNETTYGALFVDYNEEITAEGNSQNIIIYGHSMASGTYFRHLLDYKNSVSTVSNNRVITFSTLYEESQYIIVACFIIGIYDYQDTLPLFAYHTIYDFDTIEDFDYWYQNVMYRNYYTTDIECTMEDEYITLSTCSYEISDLRCVIVARKLHDGEDPSVYTYKSNPDARKPAAYYIAYGMDVPEGGPDYQYYKEEDE